MSGAGVVIFLGPTLPTTQVKVMLPDAVVLPPACQGDLYRAARDRCPTAIALIDGGFATVPAVWHREILWAIAEARIPVFGAASMGALRAAELDGYGMVGIGKIYESFHSGRYAPFLDQFEDDDEVAVSHGPPETGWVSVSAAMVDLRETLVEAEQAGIVTRDGRDWLVRELKRLHFKERSVARLVELARSRPGEEGSGLAGWLCSGHIVSQKQRDARTLLRILSTDIPAWRPPNFIFEQAQVWEHFRKKADTAECTPPVRALAE